MCEIHQAKEENFCLVYFRLCKEYFLLFKKEHRIFIKFTKILHIYFL